MTEKESMLSAGELSKFRSVVGKINWVVQGTRPDLAFELIQMSTKFQNANVDDLMI